MKEKLVLLVEYLFWHKQKSEYEINPRTQKLVKIIKGTCSICGRKESQIFTK